MPLDLGHAGSFSHSAAVFHFFIILIDIWRRTGLYLGVFENRQSAAKHGKTGQRLCSFAILPDYPLNQHYGRRRSSYTGFHIELPQGAFAENLHG
jgi:hypothetical protein